MVLIEEFESTEKQNEAGKYPLTYNAKHQDSDPSLVVSQDVCHQFLLSMYAHALLPFKRWGLSPLGIWADVLHCSDHQKSKKVLLCSDFKRPSKFHFPSRN